MLAAGELFLVVDSDDILTDAGQHAVIVAVNEASSAKTGDTVPYGFIIGAVVLAAGAAWFFAKSRKVTA